MEGLGTRENQCWYDVEDKVEGKGTGGEKDNLGAVEERNGCRVGGKKGLEGNMGRENHYGWDLIFSGEEEGQLVVEGKYIFFHNRGSVFFSQCYVLGWVLIIFHQLKNCYA